MINHIVHSRPLCYTDLYFSDSFERVYIMKNGLKKNKLGKRILLYSLGSVVMAFGIAAVIRVDFGVAPGSVVPYSLSLLTPLSVGMCSAFFQIFCIIMQLLLTGKFSIKLLLQFPLAYLFGLLLDLFVYLLDFSVSSILYCILLTTGGLLVFSLGIRAIVGSDLFIMPTDGLAKTMGEKLGWPMSKGKLLFDIIVTAAGILLMLIFYGNAFISVNIGTVICAAGTGPLIGLYTKLFPALDA